MQTIELEKTYLMKYWPKDVENAITVVLEDIYIPIVSAHPKLRIRRKGNKYEITKKTPVEEGEASVQRESTIPLAEDEYRELSLIEGNRIQKLRYKYSYNGINCEIDVFQGNLKGLVLVDFEFESPKELMDFKMSEFCLVDVTQELFIAGGMLCGKCYEDIKPELARFNYIPIFRD